MSWAGPNGNNNPFPRPNGPQPFWSWVHSLDPNARPGAGVDHSSNPWVNLPAGFPFHGTEFGFGNGSGGWGAYGGFGDPSRRGGPGPRRGGGRCGSRHHPRHSRHGMSDPEASAEEQPMRDAAEADLSDKEKDDSPDTMREAPDDGPDHPFAHGRRGRGRFPRGGGPDPWRYHGHRGHRGPHGPPPPPFAPPPPYGQHGPGGPPPPQPFDFSGFLNQWAEHPLAQQIRDWATRFGTNNATNTRGGAAAAEDEDSSFTPPVDVFATETAYVLHFALPGARKEDIGVDWDADAGHLRVAGVVYRPGDEAFLASMASGERRVGMFSRSVPLPPAGVAANAARGGEEIDAQGITARMEDGVLVVTVPKLEKEWTEIHKVDIE
ncbi:Heat shock protein 16 [Colletotrichum plurivorum]|uniref:Heat shock protein 16 n=1 Tax=Colletotrichum plurivorum TaxID=2175906 RepID=A0A8H6NRD9_9PEZI|nr:Heat shock protein 16 [Colletotrichum plurivorum]